MRRDHAKHAWVTALWTLGSALVLQFPCFAGDPALPGNHPLTQTQAGELLIAEYRCAACHSDAPRDVLFEKLAPELSNVGSRIAPSYLRRFLASPTSMHANTRMPDLLTEKSESERKLIANALTHFLVSQSSEGFRSKLDEVPNVDQGKELYHTVGCVVCHGAKEPPTESPPLAKNAVDDDDDEPKTSPPADAVKSMALSLHHVRNKYSLQSLSAFLFQPLHVRSSGRMPDMKLTPPESLAIAGYLYGSQPQVESPLNVDDSQIALGKTYFQELHCAACHSLKGFEARSRSRPIVGFDQAKGCLSSIPGAGPKFHFTQAQVQAIVAALKQPRTTERDTDEVVIAKTMTSYQCMACHVRGNYGGVHQEHSPYFVTSERNLGEDGRMPPPLTLVGAKLQPSWLKKVLFDGESVRPYMATRMPQYGLENLKHLPEVVGRQDVLDSVEIDVPKSEHRTEKEREREKMLRTGGRELLGDKGLNCIACHNFNGKPSPINKGIDLMTSYERLQSKWFNGFVRNPGAFRPRIVMPYSWSNGIASHKTILDGNTDMQIEAIWYYLSLGTSAADPSGIRVSNTKLQVDGHARTYRGRSKIAGFRGIAVGLPERINFSFNAETGTMTALWLGDFVGVNWNGQGSGDFAPSGDPIALAQDVSFAPLTDANAVWPKMPVMTKEARRNPDPLYPKNVGYQFLGYAMDSAFVPTFRYRSGSIQIEDRSEAWVGSTTPGLKRTLTLNCSRPESVWFRALTGEISLESERVFKTNRLRLTVPNGDWKLRPAAEGTGQSELILQLALDQGNTTLEFLYEPIETR
jgi:hypothetical protein